MAPDAPPLDITFLGSGNAFAAEGRAFSSFLVNGRYLFDCGPTVLQQLRKLDVPSDNIDAVFISHFHADHFYGLPFLMLDAKYGGRSKDLTIVGPPGIGQATEDLLRIGFPSVTAEHTPSFRRSYVEVGDGCDIDVGGLTLTAARVEHVEEHECFAYGARLNGRTIVYSGDTTLCDGLLRLIPGADVVVLECSCDGVAVHLSPNGVETVKRHASPGTKLIVTHLDGNAHPHNFDGLIVAQDLARYSF
ncbi:MAG TPA: ribonuclease Z [Dehalococcoidia bacterium]|nr:ribonuclease Z [Dehalococcoidia bacterium]